MLLPDGRVLIVGTQVGSQMTWCFGRLDSSHAEPIPMDRPCPGLSGEEALFDPVAELYDPDASPVP